jgi:hypothetical protein
MSSNGALLQLVSKGAQDILLTTNPSFSFFRSGYRKHSNFSKVWLEDLFQNGTNFGSKSVYNMYARGDLLSNVILKVELPVLEQPAGVKLKYINAIGHSIIENCRLIIGTQIINEFSGEFLDIMSELNLPGSKINAYNEMIGKLGTNANSIDSDVHIGPMTLFIPLKFYFTKSPDKAIPIYLLQHHKIRIEIQWKKLSELVINDDVLLSTPVPSNVELKASLYLETIYLDTCERVSLANQMKKGMSYLIEQIQVFEKSNILYQNGTENISIRNFNHPVKELIWIVQRTDVDSVDIPSSVYGNDWLNYTTELGTPSGTVIDTFSRFKLKLDNHDRTLDLDSAFLRLVTSLIHHRRVSNTYIYTYSFALSPEDWKPSGSLNFSRVDNSDVQIIFKGIAATPNPERRNIRMYAINYNLLILKNGMASLYFVN